MMKQIVLLTLISFFACRTPLEQLARTKWDRGFENILIDSTNSISPYRPCEPSIFISPVNKQHMVAAVVLNKTFYSHDGGRNWTMQLVESPYGVFGDPVITADYKGYFYFAHLSDPEGVGRASDRWLDRIVVQRSVDQGVTWSPGSYAGMRHPADQDKHWLVTDPRTAAIYMTWTEFDKYGSGDPAHNSRILFSKSVNQGISWSSAIPISEIEGDCIDSDNTTEGAVPAVGPDGTVYVAWSHGEHIYFDRSVDLGVTWLEKDMIATKQVGGWDIDIPGLGRANGMPVTAVDLSESPYRGTIYINYCDQRNGPDDTDVWLVRSTDYGESWSEPVRVNDDPPGKHQFFSWMAVDPVTGGIYIVFYDRRAYTDTQTDVYLAASFDGGSTFENVLISEEPFTPNPSVFFGDYNNISVNGGVVRPIWTRMDSNRTSIWTALIDLSP